MATAESLTEEQALFVEMLCAGLPLEVAAAELGLTAGILHAWYASPRYAYLVSVAMGPLDQVERKLIDIELTMARARRAEG